MATKVYVDKNGYKRGELEHSDLHHRQIAYKEIYLPNKHNYSLPFSQYQIHHKDENKQNNAVSNLQIVTKEEHEEIHGINHGARTHNNYSYSATSLHDQPSSVFSSHPHHETSNIFLNFQAQVLIVILLIIIYWYMLGMLGIVITAVALCMIPMFIQELKTIYWFNAIFGGILIISFIITVFMHS